MPESNCQCPKGPFENRACARGYYRPDGCPQRQPIKASAELRVERLDVGLCVLADRECAEFGDIIKYTIKVSNDSSMDICSVTARCALSHGAEFLPEPRSRSYSGGEAWEYSVNIGDIKAGESASLTAEARVTDRFARRVECAARAEFKFSCRGGCPEKGETNCAKAVTLIIRPDLCVKKSSDKCYAAPGGEIVYGVRVENTGDIDIADITVTDELPEGMEFKRGSTLKDGSPLCGEEDPSRGISVGTLRPGEHCKVEFTAIVKDGRQGRRERADL